MDSDLIKLEPPKKPIKAETTLPGSKSYSNRALMLAAQADGITTLMNPSPSDDSIAMVHGLQQVGVVAARRSEECWEVEAPHNLSPYRGGIDVGPAGTTMRFLTALMATTSGVDVTLHGSERMHQRPISDLVTTLMSAGASIEYLGIHGNPPLRIRGRCDLIGEDLRIPGSTSSQFISALLLVSSRFAGDFKLSVEGPLTSRSYVDMTLQSLAHFGVDIQEPTPNVFVLPGGKPKPSTYEIECDLSGASYFWGMACVSGGEVTVHNVNRNSAQGDIRFLDLIRQMGAEVEFGVRSVTVRGPKKLRGISCDMSLLPDTAQSLAVVAACAEGATEITGLHTLRVKETDRIAALVKELGKTGIQCDATADTIRVFGGSPAFAEIDTYDDHRMAMAFAILGARNPGIAIRHPNVVTKSFPAFWKVAHEVLGSSC